MLTNHDSNKIGNWNISDDLSSHRFQKKKPDRSKGDPLSLRSKKGGIGLDSNPRALAMLPAGNYIDTMSFVVAIVFLGQQLS